MIGDDSDKRLDIKKSQNTLPLGALTEFQSEWQEIGRLEDDWRYGMRGWISRNLRRFSL